MLLALLFAAGAQAAAPALPIDENFAQADLAGVIALYEDTSGQQDFAVAREQSFMPASQRGTNFGFSRSAWWVRVQLANQGDRDREVLLRQDYPLIDHLDVWTCARSRPGPSRIATSSSRCAWPRARCARSICATRPRARSTSA